MSLPLLPSTTSPAGLKAPILGLTGDMDHSYPHSNQGLSDLLGFCVRGPTPARVQETLPSSSLRPQRPLTSSLPGTCRALELSLELSRVSLERDSLSRELLRTIRQKVALTQELEAWQVKDGA